MDPNADKAKRRHWLIIDIVAVAAIAGGYAYTSNASHEQAAKEARDRLRRGGQVMVVQENKSAIYRSLDQAVKNDDVSAVKAIIPSQIDLNSSFAWNALFEAANTGKINVVKLWLDGEWPAAKAANIKITPARAADLLARSSCSESPEFVRLLLAKGAKLSSHEELGHCLLMAAQRLNAEVVTLFLEQGANPDYAEDSHRMVRDKPNTNPKQHHLLERDHLGWTPLMHASLRGYTAVTSTLLQHGADPTMKSPGGDTARSLAVERGQKGIIALLDAAAQKRTTGSASTSSD